MTSSIPLKATAAALVAMAALAACDRNREDLPTAANDPASGAMGTPPAETAGTTVTPSPDSTVQQNPTGAGGLSGPNGTTGTTGTTGTMDPAGTSGTTGTQGTVTSPADTGSTSGTSGVTGDMGTGATPGNTGNAGSR